MTTETGLGAPARGGHRDELACDILVVGGGLGGVAAAIAALDAGRTVVLTEEYRWLGGQLTSQGVPADEHSWVEQFGVTARFRALRNGIRDYYRRHYPLTASARALPTLNPGNGLVGRVCAEPLASAAVLDELLAPYRATGRLIVLQPAVPVAASVTDDRVDAVTVRLTDDDRDVTITAGFVLDATELGDLLPLAGAEHVTGFESRADTGEPSAPDEAQPLNQQAFSWCFIVDHVEGDHTIDKPANYDYWRARQPEYWGAPMISLTGPDPRTLEIFTRTFTPNPDPLGDVVADQGKDAGDRELWTFRRIIDRTNFVDGTYPSDVVLVNWPMIDHIDAPLVGPGVTAEDAARAMQSAREQSLAMLYWLQTEAPRADGGTGLPGLRLRGDLGQGPDGLMMAPYIRESRRMLTVGRLTENELSIAASGQRGPFTTDDSVGVGMYRIDLHPTTGGDNYLDMESRPFEIPLGILIPQRMTNLLPAGKNVGTTHITNGALRLHPVEWNIGEAAGTLAAFCLDRAVGPRAVHTAPALLREFQSLLTQGGVELHWPDVTGY